MKNSIFIAIALLSMSACKQSGPDKADLKNDSLSSVISERDSSLYYFISSFNEVEATLDSVAAKQQIISLNTDNFHGEFKGTKKEHINAEITAINNLMERNRKELDELKKRISNSKHKNALLEKTIATLTIQLSQKDYELCELNLKLDALNAKVTKLVTTVDSLTEQNYIESIIINYQATSLHSVYYKIGEAKELRDEKIIDLKGGLLGIGRTSTLGENFDNSLFTLIDFTKISTIPVNGDDIKIITNNPSDPSTLDMDISNKGKVKNLVITNPAKFWSKSKYLVIIKK